jgi:hypothetical protein
VSRFSHRWIAIFAGSSAILLFGSCVFAQVTAIRVGTIIDPAHGTHAKDQIILVEHGTITAVGTRISIPAGADVIDLRNEWLTAGLIDAHTHMTLSVGFAGDAPFEAVYLTQSSALRGLRGLHTAQVVLYRGFTTLRDVGHAVVMHDADFIRARQRNDPNGRALLQLAKPKCAIDHREWIPGRLTIVGNIRNVAVC